MSERRIMWADFVKDEWAVEWQSPNGVRYFAYTREDYEKVCPQSDWHWRKVRLCPPPVEPRASDDEIAWRGWYVQNHRNVEFRAADAFLAGRRTMRDESTKYIEAIDRQHTHCTHEWNDFRKSLGLNPLIER